MISNHPVRPLYASGISLSFQGYGDGVPQWSIYVRIFDSRFADTTSIEGEIRMAYRMPSEDVPDRALQLKKQIEALGIQWSTLGSETPLVYMAGDGEEKGTPDIWKEVVRRAAAALGWVSAYDNLKMMAAKQRRRESCPSYV